MTKKLFILFILLIIFYPDMEYAYSENFSNPQEQSSITLNFHLSGDILYRSGPDGITKLYDKVAAISFDRDSLYYIRSSGDKWIAGFYRQNFDAGIEFDIPVKYEKLYKFAGSNNVFYYLAQPAKETADDKTDAGPVFTRFNPDQNKCQSVEGVDDFILLNGKSLTLKRGALDYNGVLMPLSLSGSMKISGVIDSRIAIISGTDGTEIVDFIAEKSIYQYKDNYIAESPHEYNIILEFEDRIMKAEASPDADNSIYYEILVDGVEENRTETGRAELLKTFHAKLDAGKYHIIKPERWELDKAKGRYARINNVYQPAELKIFVPENRILKVKMEFDGTGYKYSQSVLFK